MPELGQTTTAKDIGKKGNYKYIWRACVSCGKESWSQLETPYHEGKPRASLCKSCAGRKVGEASKGSNNINWKNGRTRNGPYIDIMVSSNDFFFPMVNKGRGNYIAEHRLVMAKHLGRCLHPWEFVHHKNGIKDDNRIENLELTTLGNHIADHNKGYGDGYRKGLADGRLKQIQELKARIAQLEASFSGHSSQSS
jgi:hypothetical protein